MPHRPLSIVVILVITGLLAACAGAPPQSTQPTTESAPVALSGELTVFAAASLTEAFTAIGISFEQANPGTKVTYSFAGSQQLAAQIGEGAPADVFASANAAQMQVAVESGRINADAVQTFARNRLVLITPADNPAGITALADLIKPDVRLVIADSAVPVGRYTLDVFAKAGTLPEYTANYSATVLANVVSYEEDVRSVLAKIALGEGDAGIVYSTDAAIDPDAVQQIAIPDALNTIAAYPFAPLNDSPNAALAQAFIEYVLSERGQSILRQYGFIAR